ncbi:hypothetical protein CMV_003153 [Castanea mollissima]|uniref:Uncharacterized protein n=1 Tax=Castanea mollissima TaxID=60419 RepID=A0A8J4RSJ8_9ROSI|nr:hypothetical protein CMV_003153 [Castanea mollissima]
MRGDKSFMPLMGFSAADEMRLSPVKGLGFEGDGAFWALERETERKRELRLRHLLGAVRERERDDFWFHFELWT